MSVWVVNLTLMPVLTLRPVFTLGYCLPLVWIPPSPRFQAEHAGCKQGGLLGWTKSQSAVNKAQHACGSCLLFPRGGHRANNRLCFMLKKSVPVPFTVVWFTMHQIRGHRWHHRPVIHLITLLCYCPLKCTHTNTHTATLTRISLHTLPHLCWSMVWEMGGV